MCMGAGGVPRGARCGDRDRRAARGRHAALAAPPALHVAAAAAALRLSSGQPPENIFCLNGCAPLDSGLQHAASFAKCEGKPAPVKAHKVVLSDLHSNFDKP